MRAFCARVSDASGRSLARQVDMTDSVAEVSVR